MAWKAILDADGVLTGFVRSGNATGPDVPAHCDLEQGRYRWDEENRSFDPLPVSHRRVAGEENQTRAIWAGLSAIDAAMPDLLPAVTRRWLDQYGRTIDALVAPENHNRGDDA
jgi:hypothetical protein